MTSLKSFIKIFVVYVVVFTMTYKSEARNIPESSYSFRKRISNVERCRNLKKVLSVIKYEKACGSILAHARRYRLSSRTSQRDYLANVEERPDVGMLRQEYGIIDRLVRELEKKYFSDRFTEGDYDGGVDNQLSNDSLRLFKGWTKALLASGE
ncbi:uncharacterized protein LOC143449312 [Clavelina lepadiformis]|uniref:Uncharacterized protein n=1 Tax=Clavelina lepadiformis TaxID=159417 RepID=A0ABP0GJ57_CLALP